MIILLGIILLVIFLLIIFLIIPVQIRVFLKKIEENEDFHVELILMPGLWSYQLEMTVMRFELKDLIPYLLLHFETEGTDGTPIYKGNVNIHKPWNYWHKLIKFSPFNNFKIILNIIREILIINKNFFKKINCQKLCWITYIGAGDPAVTALATGNIWALKSIFFINLKNNVQVNFKKPIYGVYPNFQKREFKIDFNCIFTFRLGYIITAGCKTLIVTIKSLLAQRG